jgi:hypothetical protein
MALVGMQKILGLMWVELVDLQQIIGMTSAYK